MSEAPPVKVMRTRAVPACPRCAGPGELLYRQLEDRLFAVPGNWNVRRCLQPFCRILWVDPAPLVEDLAEAYRHYFTHAAPKRRLVRGVGRLKYAARKGYLARNYGAGRANYAQSALGLLCYLHPGFRSQLDHEALHLSVLPNGHLLDVGCGSGETLGLAQELGWQVSGVDMDAAAVAVARRSGFRVHVGSVATADFEASSFDAISVYHVLEHVPDPQALLRDCQRLLRPGGRLVLATPNPESRGHRRFGPAWIGLDIPRHLQLFPSQTLRADVVSAGFRVLKLVTTVHGSEFVYKAGRSVETTGYHDLKARCSWRRSLAAFGFTYASWFGVTFGLEPADETVIIAQREN